LLSLYLKSSGYAIKKMLNMGLWNLFSMTQIYKTTF
jgi:hypothetical protein